MPPARTHRTHVLVWLMAIGLFTGGPSSAGAQEQPADDQTRMVVDAQPAEPKPSMEVYGFAMRVQFSVKYNFSYKLGG